MVLGLGNIGLGYSGIYEICLYQAILSYSSVFGWLSPRLRHAHFCSIYWIKIIDVKQVCPPVFATQRIEKLGVPVLLGLCQKSLQVN
jgi:hypothetical protein